MMLLLKEKKFNINATNEEKNKRRQENGRDITMHQSASIVARDIHQKLKMNVGNYQKIKIIAHQHANPTKALDGVRSPS